MMKRKKRYLGISKTAFQVFILLLIGLLAYNKYGDHVRDVRLKAYPKKYFEYVELYADKYGIDSDIVYSVIRTESGFDPNAVSHAGAVGLMQITPDTYDWLLFLRGEEKKKELTDPETNIDFGTYFLAFLYGKYQNYSTVYAAYNAGYAKVNSWLNDERYSSGNTLINIPYKETENYVVKVENALKNYKELYP